MDDIKGKKKPGKQRVTVADICALGDRLYARGSGKRPSLTPDAFKDLQTAARLLWHFVREMQPRNEIELICDQD
jgi:hypothetical protein